MRLLLLLLLFLFLASPVIAEPIWYDIFDTTAVWTHYYEKLTIDPFQNAYVVIWANFYPNDGHLEVIKYAPDGARLWVRLTELPTVGGELQIRDIASDSTGLYVLGQARNASLDSILFHLVKIDTSGQVVWARSCGAKQSFPSVLQISGDKVIILGSTWREETKTDLYLASFSRSGDLLWERFFFRYSRSTEVGYAMTSDTAGNIYATGFTKDSLFGSIPDVLVVKYSTEGDLLWTSIYDGPTHLADSAKFIVTRGNRLFVGGFTTALDLSTHVLILQYNTDSLLIRESEYSGACQSSQPRNCYDALIGMALDEASNLYAIANSNSTEGGGGVGALTILKYRASGSREWVKFYTPADNIHVTAREMAVEGDQIHVLGQSSLYEFMLIGFALTGDPTRQESWQSPFLKPAYASHLDLDDFRNVYLLASTERPGLLSSINIPVVLKYAGKCCLHNRGDISASDAIDLSDLALMVGRLTLQPPPIIPCPSASDLNASGQVDLTDLALMIGYLTLTPRPSFSTCP